jgi:hypothetical protein
MRPDLLEKVFARAMDGIYKIELAGDEPKLRLATRDLAKWVVYQARSYARYQESADDKRNAAWIEVGQRAIQLLRDEGRLSLSDFERFMDRLDSELEASQRGVHWEALEEKRAGLSHAEATCVDLRDACSIYQMEYILRRARFAPSSEAAREGWAQMLTGAIAARSAERVSTRRYATARRDWLTHTEKTLQAFIDEGVSPSDIRRYLRTLRAYVEKLNAPNTEAPRETLELKARLEAYAEALSPSSRDVYLVRSDQGLQLGKDPTVPRPSKPVRALAPQLDASAARGWLQVARATLLPFLKRRDVARILANGLIQLAAEAGRAQAELERPSREDREGHPGWTSTTN